MRGRCSGGSTATHRGWTILTDTTVAVPKVHRRVSLRQNTLIWRCADIRVRATLLTARADGCAIVRLRRRELVVRILVRGA